jgi:hypothetical protein
MRRIIVLVLMSVCIAGGAAACSAARPSDSHTPSSPAAGSLASGTDQAMTVMRQLAHCIRSHGMPGWPDPIINPLTNAPDWPPSAPRVPDGIQQACQPIANRLPPDAQNSQPPTAASMQALLRFAHCMRIHGVPDWPDPNPLGEFPMTTQMSIAYKAADQHATSACIRYVPGGSQYLQFVGTAQPQPRSGGVGNG